MVTGKVVIPVLMQDIQERPVVMTMVEDREMLLGRWLAWR